jgi:hypothetical protein
VTVASGSKAAGVSKNISSARLHEHESRTRKNQEERDPPRKNRGSRQKTGGKKMNQSHNLRMHFCNGQNATRGIFHLWKLRQKTHEENRSLLAVRKSEVELYFPYFDLPV